jgi:hypothetical protein
VHLQLRIFRLQYSGVGICAAVVDITTIQCALYCKLGDKYSAHRTVYAIWTVSRTCTMQLQLRIFRPQYSTESIGAAIGDISTIECALDCKRGAKYSAHPPDYAIWTVAPDIYNANTVPHILASIFKWTYLRCYWRYLDNSMPVILQTRCQISRTSSSLRNVNCGPDNIQYNDSST